MSSYVKLACFLTLSFLIGACSSLPKQSSLPAAQRQQQLESLQNFQLRGALGVKTQTQSLSGNLSYSQKGLYYQTSLTNFVGISLFDLETTSLGASIKVDGQTHHAESASYLVDYLSGWSLPLEEMPFWLKGLASPSSSNQQQDAQGRLIAFELNDSQNRRWKVTYPEFFPDALALPKRVVLESTTDGTRIRLVVKQWQY